MNHLGGLIADEKPPIDRHSDAWIRHLRPWINLRIEELRDELERAGIDVEHVRGQIAELRNIIRQVEPDLPEEGTSSAYFSTGKSPS